TLTDIWEARKIMEVAVLPLVAERATQEDWRKIEQAIEIMDTAIAKGDLGLEGDILFHHALFEACHNPVLLSLREVVGEFFRKVQQMALSESLEARRKAAEEHKLMYKALRKGDVRKAQRLMVMHLDSPVKRGIIPRPHKDSIVSR
ncbi:MAG TPA: FCD domain-containing protein, partial [Armatimonadetes bacterium]|nr:FCD domain-containing protein [Armatimonadota bacterium]